MINVWPSFKEKENPIMVRKPGETPKNSPPWTDFSNKNIELASSH